MFSGERFFLEVQKDDTRQRALGKTWETPGLKEAIEDPHHTPRTRSYEVTLEPVWWWPDRDKKQTFTLNEEQYQYFRYNKIATEVSLDAFFTPALAWLLLFDAKLLFGVILGFSPLIVMPFIVAYAAGKAMSAAEFAVAGEAKTAYALAVLSKWAIGCLSLIAAAYFLGPMLLSPLVAVIVPLMFGAYFAGKSSEGPSPWYKFFLGQYYSTREE